MNTAASPTPVQGIAERSASQAPLPARAVFQPRRLLGFLGPGYLIAVGYLDPGNWATGLAAGSAYGYSLLWIVALSSAMATLLQILASRLGVAAGLDLAQACRAHSRPRSIVWQWLLCELAICATDMAEVIGTAIALQLLFGLPLAVGVAITVLDVLVVLWLQQKGVRYLEAVVISLLLTVAVCLAWSVAAAHPAWHDLLGGFIPNRSTLTDPSMLYISIGIIGATVMPHNLYLHSAVVRTQRVSGAETRERLRGAAIDIATALGLAFLINAGILVLAAAAFHAHGQFAVAELADAHAVLTVASGGVAGTMFACALLASGQSSSITATLAGQVVMEGYLRLTVAPWIRRLVTRSIAIVPALFVTLAYGETGIGKLLLASQVVLSLQLPFAVIPLIRFTSSRRIMGVHASGRATKVAAASVAGLIVFFNLLLVWRVVSG